MENCRHKRKTKQSRGKDIASIKYCEIKFGWCTNWIGIYFKLRCEEIRVRTNRVWLLLKASEIVEMATSQNYWYCFTTPALLPPLKKMVQHPEKSLDLQKNFQQWVESICTKPSSKILICLFLIQLIQVILYDRWWHMQGCMHKHWL